MGLLLIFISFYFNNYLYNSVVCNAIFPFMIKCICFLLFTCCIHFSDAQSDFLVLRKRNNTIQSFFTGSFIQFRMGGNYWTEGRIKQIKNDSLYIEQMVVRQVANYWGLPTIDTLKLGILKITVAEIDALPLKNKGFTFIKNGKIFQLGSALYVGLNIINGLTTNDNDIFSKRNTNRLGIAAIVFMIGKILQWNHPEVITIGKKYKIYSTASMHTN